MLLILLSCRPSFDAAATTADVERAAAAWAARHSFTGVVDCAEATPGRPLTECVARLEPGHGWPTQLRCSRRRCIESDRCDSE